MKAHPKPHKQARLGAQQPGVGRLGPCHTVHTPPREQSQVCPRWSTWVRKGDEDEWWVCELTTPGHPGKQGSRLNHVCLGSVAEWPFRQLGLGGQPGYIHSCSRLLWLKEQRPCQRGVQGGQDVATRPQCFGISLCPLFTFLLRVPTVLRVITENSIPHPFTFQAAKRLQPP